MLFPFTPEAAGVDAVMEVVTLDGIEESSLNRFGRTALAAAMEREKPRTGMMLRRSALRS